MVLRFGNPIFGPLWRASIRSVQITVAETVGVGSRATTIPARCAHGAEPPVAAAVHRRDGAAGVARPGRVRDEKLKVLRSLRWRWPTSRATRCAQHTAGAVDPAGEGLSRGRQRAGRQPRGNLVRARTSQQLALGQRAVLPAHRQAAAARTCRSRSSRNSNRLVIQLQPEESIQLQMLAKEPGSGMNMVPVSLNLDLQQATGAARGSVRAFADRRDPRPPHAFHAPRRAEAAWSWVEPILDGWKQRRPAAPVHGRHVQPRGFVACSRATGCPSEEA